MNIIIDKDYESMSKKAADFIAEYIEKKPDTLLCIAGGETPMGIFRYLVKYAAEKKIDFSQCKFVSLDEWVGLGRDTKGSCKETLYNNFFDLIPVKEEQICFFDGLAADMEDECRKTDKFISDHGNIDLIVLGIGMNGHIGFNEPNVPLNTECHVVALDPVTKKVSVKYFDTALDVKQGISLGMQTISRADTILLIADDIRKADIVKKTVEGEKTPEVPSSLFQDFPKLWFFMDEAAASKLAK